MKKLILLFKKIFKRLELNYSFLYKKQGLNSSAQINWCLGVILCV